MLLAGEQQICTYELAYLDVSIAEAESQLASSARNGLHKSAAPAGALSSSR